ncbi:MAG: Recombination protein RecR [candidate division TM6 bacterium GW2011_GWF2_43_17]|nr:MAG: Recombination protein RecR [candidate division TM6 bacterium GW2011_GWF2_43_17]HAU30155.1 recombination protein RecR [Candidatus Dependentiae bacterium]
MDGLPSLNRLIRQLQRLPYLASKNVYRVSQYFLELSTAQREEFCRILLESCQSLRPCPICCAWSEVGSGCLFCDASTRDRSIICVVESWYDLQAIEHTGVYKGLYHVLGGVLSPLDGIGPNELLLDKLQSRVGSTVKEVVLALNQTPESDATAAFIARLLKVSDVLVTCLARGLPVGASLEYSDRLTLNKALLERRMF